MDAAFRKWETGNHVRVPGTRSPSPWPSIIRIVGIAINSRRDSAFHFFKLRTSYPSKCRSIGMTRFSRETHTS